MHSDRSDNMDLLRSWGSHHEDVLVLVGDISHRSEVIEETLELMKSKFAEVFFVPGNHEVRNSPPESTDGTC